MLTARDPVNVVIAGVGGQGNVLVARLVGEMMLAQGLTVVIGETYGASQRGGAVMSHVRLSRGRALGPLVPAGQADLVVALEPAEALRMLGPYGHPGVAVVTNVRPVLPLSPTGAPAAYPEVTAILAHLRRLAAAVATVPATAIALELGDPVLANMAVLGAVAALGLLPFDRAAFVAAAGRALPAARLDVNLRAFDVGAAQVAR
ncbi:MAG TPA: 2-oxoacid:acceptor oxidoreductase family protein [Polyangia bacterium]